MFMLDEFSKTDPSFNLDNNFFSSNYGYDNNLDYLSIPISTSIPVPVPVSIPIMNPIQSNFYDNSAPPNENPEQILDPTLLSTTIIPPSPNNQDYNEIPLSDNSMIYDNIDKQNTNTVSYFTSDNINNVMFQLSFYDIMVIFNILISILLIYKYHHMYKKIKKLKHILNNKNYSTNISDLSKLPMK
jgi:hypothetical protein